MYKDRLVHGSYGATGSLKAGSYGHLEGSSIPSNRDPHPGLKRWACITNWEGQISTLIRHSYQC